MCIDIKTGSKSNSMKMYKYEKKARFSEDFSYSLNYLPMLNVFKCERIKPLSGQMNH